MSTDEWTMGPDLLSGRGDLALAITDAALYAMGGDDDGNTFFDSTDGVTRLEWGAWPGGSWSDLTPGLPVAYTGNNAGFCTQAIAAGSEIWSLGGISLDFTIDGANVFRPSQTEHCYSIYSDVTWLSESSTGGTVDPDSDETIDITFDSTGLAPGDYNATLVITTNDFGATQFNIPVTLHVTACDFCDEFNNDSLATDWTYTGTWDEDSAHLFNTSTKKASAIASPAYAGCQDCSFGTSFSTTGGKGSKVLLYGWWVDKKNVVEVEFDESKDQVSVKQKAGGSTVKKQKGAATLTPNTFHNVTLTRTGGTIVINVDGTDVMTFTAVGSVPSGTFGFGVKKASVQFDYIHVN
jgi:hypothetical protein